MTQLEHISDTTAQRLLSMKTIYLILGISQFCQLTKGCNFQLDPVAVVVNGAAEFQFNPVTPGGTVTYIVLRGSEPPKLVVPYTFGTPDPVQTDTDITFTGDTATGDISLSFTNVQLSDNGTYVLQDSVPSNLQCIVLYVLGKPIVSVSKDQDPKVGESVEFTCDATSTTVPSPAPYDFTFSWTFGSLTDPTGARYMKVGNKFKISQVGKDDEGKNVACKATEDVSNGLTSDPSSSVSFTVSEPECCCCCCCICCFIVLIVSVAVGILFTGGHIGLTWADHEYSVKKIRSENNATNKTSEAVCLKDYVIKAVLPECCICVVVIIVQIAVYFAALKKDCNENEHCDDCCGVFICLVVTIIVSVVKDATESGIIYLVVHVKGCNYIHQGDDQQPSDRLRDEDDRYQSDEPKSNTTKTDEAGSFVSGKDIKVDTGGSSSWRAQPPLPEIRSEKKNTRGLSANINDSDINPSYEKKRLTPIGQESQPGWEEKTDRSEDGKEKKKKRKSRDQERDSNVTESADL